MSERLGPRSRYYDGVPYALVMDPLLAGLRRRVAEQLPEGGRVLDACCGTGALAMALAPRCGEVVGVDRSPRHLAFAERRRRCRGIENVRFELGDAGDLRRYADGAFDAATVVLALHEMTAPARTAVLAEILRVARRVVLLDFEVPMPWNLAGWRNRAAELLAGRAHFAAFRDFVRREGLDGLIRQLGPIVDLERTLSAGTLALRICRRG